MGGGFTLAFHVNVRFNSGELGTIDRRCGACPVDIGGGGPHTVFRRRPLLALRGRVGDTDRPRGGAAKCRLADDRRGLGVALRGRAAWLARARDRGRPRPTLALRGRAVLRLVLRLMLRLRLTGDASDTSSVTVVPESATNDAAYLILARWPALVMPASRKMLSAAGVTSSDSSSSRWSHPSRRMPFEYCGKPIWCNQPSTDIAATGKGGVTGRCAGGGAARSMGAIVGGGDDGPSVNVMVGTTLEGAADAARSPGRWPPSMNSLPNSDPEFITRRPSAVSRATTGTGWPL